MEITIEQIISVFKNAKDTKKMAEIKKAVCVFQACSKDFEKV